jgi:tetratricopeptide (TPR) repeat protein
VASLSLALGHRRLGSLEALLAANPGYELAAIERAGQLEKAARPTDAGTVLLKCAASNPAACTCVSRAADSALDAHHYTDATALTGRAALECFTVAPLLGARAEGLAGEGKLEEAARAAAAALRLHERDAHAVYAKALVALGRGDRAESLRFAREAVGFGRGTEARVFIAGLLMQSGDRGGAESELKDALAVDPASVPALYDLALLAQEEGRYRAAREGYLRVVSLDPGALDARYNLVILTHGIGADAEASYHIDEMAKVSPGDPRIAPLRSLLSQGAGKSN